MQLEDMKVGDLLKITKLFDNKSENKFFWTIGKSYFIRTVTMHLVGKLIDYSDKELLLENASWVADSGRFHTALTTGHLEEIEPFPENVIINRDCIVDMTEWKFNLPSNQK